MSPSRCRSGRRVATRASSAPWSAGCRRFDGAQGDDDLVEERVDLILVVPLAELRRLEPRRDDLVGAEGPGPRPCSTAANVAVIRSSRSSTWSWS
jgi:hypothetical protein